MKSIYLLLALCCIGLPMNDCQAQFFTKELKVVGPNRNAGDNFGYSVAVSDHTAAIGAVWYDYDSNGGNYLKSAGAVFLYEIDADGNWQEQQVVTAPFRSSDDEFGTDIAISGNYMVISSYFDDEDQNEENFKQKAGAAYIYERNEMGRWEYVQKIVASDRQVADFFGVKVDLFGNQLIVAADWQDYDANGANYLLDAGAAYIFERDSLSGQWAQTQKLVPSNRLEDLLFGSSVAINDDFAFVGFRSDFLDAQFSNPVNRAGSVYIFKKEDNGEWKQHQKIVASDRHRSALFGGSIDLEGNQAIATAVFESYDEDEQNFLEDAGAAYIFNLDKNGFWTEIQKITPPDRAEKTYFGYRTAMADNYLIVSARNDHENSMQTDSFHRAGAAYVYRKKSDGYWIPVQRLQASDRESEDVFSFDLGISKNQIIVGAPFEDEDRNGMNSISNSGSAYIFELCPAAVDLSISQSNDTLTANALGFNYQWLDCDNNNEPIVGATDRSFTPSRTSGNYAVEISSDACSVQSECVEMISVSNKSPHPDLIVKLYPNPTAKQLIIERNSSGDLQIELTDNSGKTLLVKNWNNQRTSFDLGAFPMGIYYLTIRHEGIQMTRKIIKLKE